ncbi:hypothetical protein RB620_03565 [Paenibacillus sp. LHD-117]|uniref:hypothetical protein n=1 Tax=Paenibacillus sp. LHD-117 TaxID=3071412 RepID=UPI0027E1154A|nr:hypothetical protein [Paenibacillus sp. LHD-117]MDQ6418508.1 hypothetical protein [Paenibacillus sp. LHD-117]
MSANHNESYSRYVNTITGCVADVESANIHGGGKTYPGAVMPFGMVQLSPDTITGGDNGPGYSYHHETIEGFSFNHLSGIGWYGDLGNLQVMPTTGEIRFHSGSNSHDLYQTDKPGWKSRYDHTSEVTQAGYYAVTLDDYHIRAEMTATYRAGILRFTFLETDDGQIQIDLARRIAGRSTKQYIKVTGRDTIEGWIHCPPEGGGFGHGEGHVNYTLYFYGKFNKQWNSFGLWNKGDDLGSITECQEEDLGFYAVSGKPPMDVDGLVDERQNP